MLADQLSDLSGVGAGAQASRWQGPVRQSTARTVKHEAGSLHVVGVVTEQECWLGSGSQRNNKRHVMLTTPNVCAIVLLVRRIEISPKRKTSLEAFSFVFTFTLESLRGWNGL